MASPRFKNSCQEQFLVLMRILAFVSTVLIVGYATWLTAIIAGAPPGFAGAIGGATAGIAGFFMLVFGKFFDIQTFYCPHCGHSDRTLKGIGYYNCFNCNTKYFLSDEETTQLNA